MQRVEHIKKDRNFCKRLISLKSENLLTWPILDSSDVKAGVRLLERMSDPREAPLHLESYNGQGIVKEFEESCLNYFTKSEYCLATSSGYSALLIALLAMDIGPGDEVIVPALCYGQAISPVIHLGAKVIFADVQKESMNICPESVKNQITPKTKAIICVHTYGNPCDMSSLLELSRQTGVPLVEDACQSMGATYKGLPLGQFGKVACFSTGSPKQLSVGTGGFLLTNDNEVYRQSIAKGFRYHRNMTYTDTKNIFDDSISYTNDMAPMTAGLAISRLKSLDQRNNIIKENILYFKSFFSEDRVCFVKAPKETEGVFFRVSLRFNLEKLGMTLKEFKRVLTEVVGWKPGLDFAHPIFPLYKTERIRSLYKEEYQCPVSEDFFENTLSFRSIRWQTRNCKDLIESYAKIINSIYDYCERLNK